MRRDKFKIFFVIFSIVLIIVVGVIYERASSYDSVLTHPGIVVLAAKLHNDKAERKLTLQEINWLAEGAELEDTPTRWLNHFYDPVSSRGLKGIYLSAKKWAKNSDKQKNYALGDNSWLRAIDDYKKGNYEQAFKALGHVLHLIADVSVPAHTRDDIHIYSDSYEEFVKQNWHALKSRLDQENLTVNNLENIFDQLAFYSNNNFFSDDTIVDSKYKLPSLEFLDVQGDYLISNLDNKDYKLAYKLARFRQSIFDQRFIIYKLDASVLSDYARFLLPKAISYSASVINLFFAEIQNNVPRNLSSERVNVLGQVNQAVGAVVSKGEEIIEKISLLEDQKDVIYENVLNLGDKLDPNESMAEFFVVEDKEKNDDDINNIENVPIETSKEEVKLIELPSIILENNENNSYAYLFTAIAADSDNLTASNTVASVVASSTIVATSTLFTTTTIFVTSTLVTSTTAVTSTIVISTSSIINSSLVFDAATTTDDYYVATSTNQSGVVSPSSTVSDDLSMEVIINEIAWAGVSSDFPKDEWFELYNNTDKEIDITNWKILVSGREIKLENIKNIIIKPYGYYLLEANRTERMIGLEPDALYDLTYGINNQGAKIELFNEQGVKIDEVDCSNGWFFGDNVKYRSMERLDSLADGNDINNWQSNYGPRAEPRTYLGGPIYGSPGMPNFGFISLRGAQENNIVDLTYENNPYVLENYEIPVGKILNIQPGVIVKGYSQLARIDVKGELNINGTIAEPVVFTSGRDNTFGYDLYDTMVGQWNSELAVGKDWQGFRFYPESTGKIDYLEMRYAGADFKLLDNDANTVSEAIRADGANININSSTFYYNGSKTVVLDNTFTSIKNTAFVGGEVAIESKDSNLNLFNLNFDYYSAIDGILSISGDWPKLENLVAGEGTNNLFKFEKIEMKPDDLLNIAAAFIGDDDLDGGVVNNSKVITLFNDWQYLFSELSVEAGVTLRIKEGTNIYLNNRGVIDIKGQLESLGTADKPINILPFSGSWAYIIFNNTSSTLNYTNIISGGAFPEIYNTALLVNNSNLNLNNCYLWNHRQPGNVIKATNSILNLVVSEIGADNRWPNPLFPGMSYSTGIDLTGGEIYLESTNFENLNFGVYSHQLNNQMPIIKIKDMFLDNFINVYNQWEPWVAWHYVPFAS